MTILRGRDRVAVAVMAKAPIPGEAKTRLGTRIGFSAAAQIYRAFLLDTISVVDDASALQPIVEKLIVCPDDSHRSQLRPLVDGSWTVLTQTRMGLMGGIVDAFNAAFSGDATVALVTDADSPLTLLEHVATCVDLAADHDIGLGPTDDGGYYVVSSRLQVHAQLTDLFLGTSYDSSTVCLATADRAMAAGLSVGRGPVGFDVDTLDDLHALAIRLGRVNGTMLPETRRALALFDATFAVTAADS